MIFVLLAGSLSVVLVLGVVLVLEWMAGVPWRP